MLKKSFMRKTISTYDLIVWGLMCIVLNIVIAVVSTGTTNITFGVTLVVTGLIVGLVNYAINKYKEKQDLKNQQIN